MNPENENIEPPKQVDNSVPIFFKLIDSDKDRTEKTVNDLTALAEKLEISEMLQLHDIINSSDYGYISVFSLNLKTGMNLKTEDKALTFMEYIFKNMFHKHPAYIEPTL